MKEETESRGQNSPGETSSDVLMIKIILIFITKLLDHQSSKKIKEIK